MGPQMEGERGLGESLGHGALGEVGAGASAGEPSPRWGRRHESKLTLVRLPLQPHDAADWLHFQGSRRNSSGLPRLLPLPAVLGAVVRTTSARCRLCVH